MRHAYFLHHLGVNTCSFANRSLSWNHLIKLHQGCACEIVRSLEQRCIDTAYEEWMVVVKFRLINIRVLCKDIENNQILKRQYFFGFFI